MELREVRPSVLQRAEDRLPREGEDIGLEGDNIRGTLRRDIGQAVAAHSNGREEGSSLADLERRGVVVRRIQRGKGTQAVPQEALVWSLMRLLMVLSVSAIK